LEDRLPMKKVANGENTSHSLNDWQESEDWLN